MIARGWITLGVSKSLRLAPRSILAPESSREAQELASNDSDGGEDEGEDKAKDNDEGEAEDEDEDDD
jgi:hypothetical protein